MSLFMHNPYKPHLSDQLLSKRHLWNGNFITKDLNAEASPDAIGQEIYYTLLYTCKRESCTYQKK